MAFSSVAHVVFARVVFFRIIIHVDFLPTALLLDDLILRVDVIPDLFHTIPKVLLDFVTLLHVLQYVRAAVGAVLTQCAHVWLCQGMRPRVAVELVDPSEDFVAHCARE